LLAATQADLERLAAEVRRRTKKPLSAVQVGFEGGQVINRHKMAKHFQLQIANGVFSFNRDEAAIRQEEELDGIYVIRTSEPAADLGAADCVRTYKSLSLVERAFRCLKASTCWCDRSGTASSRVCVPTSFVHAGLLRRRHMRKA